MSSPLNQDVTSLRGPLVPVLGLLFLFTWLVPPSRWLPYHLPASSPADTVRGTPQDETLRGTTGDDLLDGGGGEDRLVGLAGNDVLVGGPDRDILLGGPGDDVLEGRQGGDWLDGGDGRDWLFGGEGDDRLEGGPGPDVFDGGPARDHLLGGEGDDLLDGNEGDDIVEGGPGDDTLDGGDGLDILEGGDGHDDLDGGDENDVLHGGEGADSLRGGDGGDELDGGAGDDLLGGDDGNDVLRGGTNNDGLAGGDGNDVLDGDPGDDILNGGEGDDLLVGGAGADTLLGAAGRDRLVGGGGNDILQGGEGEDVLEGDEGGDRLTGGGGEDVVRGGDGNDLILLRAGDVDSLRIEGIDGGTNRDTLQAEADTLLLSGFAATQVSSLSQGSAERVIIDPVTGGRYLVTRVEHLVYLELVAYVAAGESIVQVTNTSEVALAGRIEFRDVAGKPLATEPPGDSVATTWPLAIPPLGSVEVTLPTHAEGHLRVYSTQAAAVATYTTLPDGSAGVVPSSRFRDDFSVPVQLDLAAGHSTAIAVTTGAVGTTLQVMAVNPAGQELESTQVDVPPRGRVVVYANELFPRLTRFEGRLVVTAGQTTAIALLIRDGRATVAPVIPWAQARSAGPQRLPHLVNGEGRTSTIAIASYDSVTGGRLNFYGPDGRPVALDVEGVGSVNEVPFRFSGAGTLFVSTTGRGPAATATAVVTTERGLVSTTSWLSLGGSQVVHSGSGGARRLVAPIRLGTSESPMVVVGAGSTPAEVRLALYDPAGRQVGSESQARLPAHGHLSRSLRALFPRMGPGRFLGSLVVVTSGGSISAAMSTQTGGGPATSVPFTATP